MKTYKITGYRTEKYTLYDIEAKNKQEAIQKYNDFIDYGADWEPLRDMKYKVEVIK